MPVIVFEGPDESGKTTIATALAEIMGGVGDVTLQHSPVKEHGWSLPYAHYLASAAEVYAESLLIQDRVPEISESAYGVVRGEPRGRGYMYEAYRWLGQDIFMVFCQGGYSLDEKHTDAFDTPITLDLHYTIRCLYHQIYFNLHSAALHTTPVHFQIMEYDRNKHQDWINVFDRISLWLAGIFSDRHREISKALQFEYDSAFPLAKEEKE